MPLDDTRVDADGKGELLRKLKLNLAILKNRELGRWEAEESRPFHSYRWTFGGLAHSSGSEEFLILHTPKFDSNANANGNEYGFELQQYLPDIDDWSIPKLRKLEVALNENRVTISLLPKENESPKVPASEIKYKEPTKRLSRTYHRVRSHLFQAIRTETGHNNIPWSNPLRSHPGPPYSFEWVFSPKYPAFPAIKGGISRWSGDQFRECEEALGAGYLTIRDTTLNKPPQVNLETSPSQLVYGNISSSWSSPSFSNRDFTAELASSISKEGDITQDYTENSQQAQVLNWTSEGGGAEPQPHNEPNTPRHRAIATSISTKINILLEHDLEEHAKELEISLNQRQAVKMEALQQELLGAQRQVVKMEALHQELLGAQLQLKDLTAKMANDRQEVANFIQNARREGEVFGRARAMKDMVEDQDEALVALRKHHLWQIEKTREQSYQDGFQAGRASNQELDHHSIPQTISLTEDKGESNVRSQIRGDSPSNAVEASQSTHIEQDTCPQGESARSETTLYPQAKPSILAPDSIHNPNQLIDSASAARTLVPISKDLYNLALPRWIEISLARYQNGTRFFQSLCLTLPERELLSDAIHQHSHRAGKLGKKYSTQRQIKTLKLYISGLALELSSTYYLGRVHNAADVLKIFTALYETFMYHSWHDELVGQFQQDGGTVSGGNPIATPPSRRVSEGQLLQKRGRPAAQSEDSSSGPQKRRRHTAQGWPMNSPAEELTPSIQLGEETRSQSGHKGDLLLDNHSDLYNATPPPSRNNKIPQPS